MFSNTSVMSVLECEKLTCQEEINNSSLELLALEAEKQMQPQCDRVGKEQGSRSEDCPFKVSTLKTDRWNPGGIVCGKALHLSLLFCFP